jgi:hypothetical protein
MLQCTPTQNNNKKKKKKTLPPFCILSTTRETTYRASLSQMTKATSLVMGKMNTELL